MRVPASHRRLAVLGLVLCTNVIGFNRLRAAEPPLFPFVLPWDDATRTVTDVGGFIERDRPAGKLGPVQARDGHFYTGGKRLRLLGVNLCFGANFPTHADARKVAARMAKFGINAVRFHHMDMQSAPGGIFAPDGKTLDPGQLDKLDYLFAQLKENGIYADLNLHVSRTYPGRPGWPDMPSFHKGVDNFDPALIALQRDYARDLLTHVNPYTKTRYADEPAVALVEINNENGLTHEWFNGGLDAMPAVYSDVLQKRWNDWLGSAYKSTAALKTAWGATAQPVGGELLANGTFTDGVARWNLETHEGAKGGAVLPGETGGARAGRPVRLKVDVAGKLGWHVQFSQAGLSLKTGAPYTLTFRARADTPRRLAVNAMQAHDPWRQLWSADAAVSRDWATFEYVFSPAESDEKARVSFSNLGDRAGWVELADISLKNGGVAGLGRGESLGSVGWFKKGKFASRTVAAQRDWVRFLVALETEYWTGMADYLRKTLGVKAPLVGTAIGWSPPGVQARLDAIDSHAYWQHPDFPRKAWDMDDWTVGNQSMAGRPDGGTLPGLGLSRVAGKPFICTEYNHSAPNEFAVETAPLIFAYAAMQDWDGVFLFAYSHRTNSWDTGYFGSFFDIDQHPAKMATLPASAALFLRGDLAAGTATVAMAGEREMIDAVRLRGPGIGADAFGMKRGAALIGPVAQSFITPGSLPVTPPGLSRPSATRGSEGWVWRSEKGRPRVTVDTPRSKLLVTGPGGVPGRYAFGKLSVMPGANSGGFAVIGLTALDGPDFASPGRVLITAAGRAENTGMTWTDSTRTSVGRHWGQRPSLVEGIPALINWPVAPGRLKAWALDERGRRGKAVPVSGPPDSATIALDPSYRTLWYEVEIAR